jgi:hypothetical protein
MNYGDKIQLSNRLLRLAFSLKGIEVEEGILGIFGIRGAIPSDGLSLEIVPNELNVANDTIGLVGTELRTYRGSVDPGMTYTLKPTNPLGCAHLQLGKWRYGLGRHRGKAALVQRGEVTVRRDKDKDGKAEPLEKTYSGWYGINIHAMGRSMTVGPFSAGCQVIQGGWDGVQWTQFMRLIRESGQQEFWYYGPLDVSTLAEATRQSRASG